MAVNSTRLPASPVAGRIDLAASGSSDEALELVENLRHWLEEGQVPHAEALACKLGGTIEWNWQGIQVDLPASDHPVTPRFIREAGDWTASALSSAGLEGEALEKGVRLLVARLWGHYAGTRIYFPRTDRLRNRRIYEDHKSGEEIVDLARKYGLTSVRIYSLLRAELARARSVRKAG
ncbi:MAG: hypothetical protein HYZ13_10435 [Acidobacteria bacterium]|nr:hypothetical protein [Acidobacteriota bacterium]